MNFSCIAFLMVILCCCNGRLDAEQLTVELDQTPDQPWAGRSFWANDLSTWAIRNHKLVALSSAQPWRTLRLLTRTLSPRLGSLSTSIEFEMTGDHALTAGQSLGFWLGAGNTQDTNAMSQHASQAHGGIFVGLDGTGRLFMRSMSPAALLHSSYRHVQLPASALRLRVCVEPLIQHLRMTATLEKVAENSILDVLSLGQISSEDLAGEISLVVDRPGLCTADAAPIWFNHWELAGGKIDRHDERTFGPIAGFHYTLHDGRHLLLHVQMLPLALEQSHHLDLQILQPSGVWRTMMQTAIAPHDYSALFSSDDWNADLDTPFRILYHPAGETAFEKYGSIHKDPVEKPHAVLAAFNTGSLLGRLRQGLRTDATGPLAQTLEQVLAQNPDLFYFQTVAQESRSTVSLPDALMERILFYRQFQDLLNDRPCIAPDLQTDQPSLQTFTYAKVGMAVFGKNENNPRAIPDALLQWQTDWRRQDMKLLLFNDSTTLAACLPALRKAPLAFAPLLAGGAPPRHESLAHECPGATLDMLTLPKLCGDSLDCGYAIIKLEHLTRTYVCDCRPLLPDAPSASSGFSMPGWPKILTPFAMTGARYFLPELISHEIPDPLLRIIEEKSGRLLYSMRFAGFSHKPMVFNPGLYTVELSEPGTNFSKTRQHVPAHSLQGKKLPSVIEVHFQ